MKPDTLQCKRPGPLQNTLSRVDMTWKLVDRCEIVAVWHLLGVSPWPQERSDLFKSNWEHGLGCSEKHPPRRARINGPAPPLNAVAFEGNHNETKAELFSTDPCWVTAFVYDWAWILHGRWHFKNPRYGRTVKLGWADSTDRPSVPCERRRTTSDTTSFQKGGPDRHITFHKNRMLHLPVISWTFILLLVIRWPWNPSMKGGQIHYLDPTQRHLVWLHPRSNPGITYSMKPRM